MNSNIEHSKVIYCQLNPQTSLGYYFFAKIEVCPRFNHFYKSIMSHHFNLPFFRTPFYTLNSDSFMSPRENEKNVGGEITKLEVSEAEINENPPSDTPKNTKKEGRDPTPDQRDQTQTLHNLSASNQGLSDDIEANYDDIEEYEQSIINLSEDNKEMNQEGEDCLGEGLSTGRKKKKSRKVRTTITRQKLIAMNQIFAEYTQHREEGKNPRLNLKQIGNKLCLGYSTILHKFRQFRCTKMVKGGALIASLQKKRKYKKSLVIEEIIDKALATRPFYTAVELSDYIFQNHGKRFSRSIISRHLGQMGYSYKNLKTSPIEKNKPKYKQTRRIYADIVSPFLSSPGATILYIDELACNLATFQRRRSTFNPKDIFQEHASDYVSLMVGATKDGVITFQIKVGFYTTQDFLNTLKHCLNKVVDAKLVRNSLIVITDMNKIHLDPLDSDKKPYKRMLSQYNARRFYLPPSSPHLNPLQSMFTHLKTKLLKKDIKNTSDLKNYMHSCMEQISSNTMQVYFEDVVRCVQGARSEQSFSFEERVSGPSFSFLSDQ